MKKLLLAIVLIFSLNSCSTDDSPTQTTPVEPVFKYCEVYTDFASEYYLSDYICTRNGVVVPTEDFLSIFKVYNGDVIRVYKIFNSQHNNGHSYKTVKIFETNYTFSYFLLLSEQTKMDTDIDLSYKFVF